MAQTPFLRLSPWGLALGCAAATLAAIIVRVITFGLGFGMWHRGGGPYMHGPYGGMYPGMMGGGYAGFAILAAIAAIVFAGILGAIIALVYNAIVARSAA